MIIRILSLVAIIVLCHGPSRAETIDARSFDKTFNSAAKRLKSDLALQSVGCSTVECEFGAVPDLRLLARGEGSHGDIIEISAYLPRDAADRARSTRSVLTATSVVATLIAIFNPVVSPTDRGKAVMALMEGAAGPTRRGEIALGGVKYVLSATQGDNLRIYVTR